ncbi:MAG TPA: hypothetical protein VGC09_11000 [Rhodopila sp.]
MLKLWERAEREHPIDRVLSILSAFTAGERGYLVALPIHRRDALLLSSRVAAFGSRLDGVAVCAACGCKIDVSFDLPDTSTTVLEDEGLVEVDGRAVRVRVPDSGDLAAVAHLQDPVIAAQSLLMRCQSQPTSGAALDGAALHAIEQELERLCDTTWLDLKVACPDCEATFIVPVDIGRFFWTEIAAYAAGLIEDVHALAARYGWSESAILALPERRRRRYLELLQ